MQLYFKQRLFSWFDSYDIYNAADGSVAFTWRASLRGGTACTFSTRKGGTLPPSSSAC